MRPSDIDNDEILAALRATDPEKPRAATAGDVAHKVWCNRGTATQRLADRHVKPGLTALIAAGDVVSATGRRVGRIGRVLHPRSNTTYYVLAEYARTYAVDLGQREEMSRKGRELALALRDTHGDRLTAVKGTSDGGVAMTFTFDQATALLEQWNSDNPTPATANGPEGTTSPVESLGSTGPSPASPRREYRQVPIGQLTVDRAIRPDLPPESPGARQPDLDVLRRHYNRHELGVFIVSQRSDDTLVIIDGYRRHTVTTELEPPDFAVECWVYTGLTIAQETSMATSLNGA